jgi:hypothetical protein
MSICTHGSCPDCGKSIIHNVASQVAAPPKRASKPKKVLNRPPWLVDAARGLEGGEKYECLYDGKAWALIKQPGAMYWSSIGHRRYAQTTFEVWNKHQGYWGKGRFFDAIDALSKGECLAALSKGGEAITRFEVHRGRLNNKRLEDLAKEVDLLDRTRP